MSDFCAEPLSMQGNPCVIKVLAAEPKLIYSEDETRVLRVEFDAIDSDERVKRVSVPVCVAIKMGTILDRNPEAYIRIQAIRHDETPEQREAAKLTDSLVTLFRGDKPMPDEHYSRPLKKRIEYIVEEVV